MPAAFRRTPMPVQVAQKLETVTIPAPTRGLVLNENEAYMQPGAALVMDNWKPTLRGISLRGGCIRWCELPETTPIISGFEYASGANHKMFVANATKVYDVSTSTPVEVASGRTSGNYAASQMANAAGDFLTAVNDTGDAPLQFDGTTWTVLDGGEITGPVGTAVEAGLNLVHVCKYRNRYFFIEGNSMNAWYLPLNAIGGVLALIPLSGAAAKGGKLLFATSWSIDAGDGIDDKLVFATTLGELIIFTGGNPADPANWRQEGRYDLSPPLGMNAFLSIGGDLLVATVDGILPVSGAITKSRSELELASVTRTIRSMWRTEALDKRDQHWTIKKWDAYGGIFVTLPGDPVGKHKLLAVNSATGAWTRFTGWDAMCFVGMRDDMFFGTQTGIVMQMDRTGKDDGAPYLATLVGGWEMFQSPSQTVTWRQSRVSFSARSGEPFVPQVSACTDYIITLPPPPLIGPDPGLLDLWDEGLWDAAEWDAPMPPTNVVRNTGWVSIGQTGFTHAPIIQVYVAQQAKPEVDLIAIAATFERAGITV